MDEEITKLEEYYKTIKDSRKEIAKLKTEIALEKPKHWEDATGVAKEKEDYVKSKIGYLNEDIASYEADIEFAYNMVNVLLYQMELSDE